MKLSHALHLFLNEYQNPNTRRIYNQCLTPLQEHIGATINLTDIKPIHVVGYRQALLSRPGSEAYKNKHLKSVKTFFNWCVKIELIEKSPAAGISIKEKSAAVPKDRAMHDDELERILAYAQWKPRDHALISFLADTGCRAGGASGLKVDDLDLDKMSASVVEKGSKRRIVWYGPRTANAIKIWLKKRNAIGGYVFSADGHQLVSAVISQIVRRACKAVGVRSLGSHSLRHRKGHQMADNGIAVTTAAQVLGHESTLVTMKHYYPHDLERAAKAALQLSLPEEKTNPKVTVLQIQKTGTMD